MDVATGSDVPVRPAATVVLLRDGADGLEVWLQQRASSLVFAGGMLAFPGGAVDVDDGADMDPGFDASRHAAVWGHSLQWSTTLVAAACRETREEAGVDLPASSLTPWSRWITPIGTPRRFDAHFFLAPLPVGQSPRPLTGEVAGASWLVVTSAIERHLAGDLPMWPPTITTLGQLAPHADVAAAVGAAPQKIAAITE